MLFAILTVALIGQPVLSAEMEGNRVKVLAGIEAVLDTVVEFRGLVATRFAIDNRKPKTGLIIMSAEGQGEDGFHAVTVRGVFRESSGSAAGVLPGDRILRVNARRIEHEPETVVYSLLDDKPGPVILVLQRGQKTREVTIHRHPLACLIRGAEELDTSAWLKQLTTMRALMTTAKKQMEPEEFLKLNPQDRLAALDAAQTGVLAVTSLIPQLMDTVARELNKATMTRCQAVFE